MSVLFVSKKNLAHVFQNNKVDKMLIDSTIYQWIFISFFTTYVSHTTEKLCD